MASAPLTGIHSLPHDTLFCIFSFLPIPDLVRCAAVCEQWHEIVTGFTQLWKGKRYRSDRRRRESVEMHAILRTLPPLREVFIEVDGRFAIEISFPRLVLSVRDASDIRSTRDGPRLRCAYLSTRVDVVEAVLSSRSTIDLAALGKLRIVKTIPTFNAFAVRSDPDVCPTNPFLSSVDDAIDSALELCPNLRELCVYAEFLSEDRLDTSGRIGRLRALEIECPGLEVLTFLRRCSDTLEELELRGCADLHSAAYTSLRHLGNLRRLKLRDCCVAARDLEVAAKGMRRLASLQLDYCDRVSDLSCLRHCEQLRELRVKASPPDAPLASLRDLPAGLRSLYLAGNAVDADELSEAAPRLPLLEELHLVCCELPHLRFLRRCPRLRRLSLEFSHWCDASQLSELRHLARLEVLDLRRCRVDADVLSGTLPSLTRLDALSLSHSEGVAHLRFLRHCPQLRTLSLYFTFGMDNEEFREVCHVTDLQTLYVSEYVRDFVREVVRPCLPKVKIYCSERFK